jgi:outer membrane protein OmpA-like peptidoglycan-associated protein
MRRQVLTSLILTAAAVIPNTVESQFSSAPVGQSLAGTRELGLFGSGRILSTEYSTEDGRSAFGGTVTFGTHLRSTIVVQGGLGVNYSRQEYSYYKPPLWTFTPTISLIFQRSTAADLQPYALVGGGYEFVSYTHPRCDCEQTRSLGIGNLGLGVRKMMGSSRAFRAELSSQIGKGGPTFTGMAGMSLFLGTRRDGMRPPGRVRTEPIVPRQSTTIRPATNPPAATPPAANPPVRTAPAPQPPPPAPANNVLRAPSGSPLPTGVGAVLLSFDGTQVDFTRTNWAEDAQALIDALVVDLTSDAGQNVKISIEAHTDNVGSNAANIMIGLDRARAVREYIISQGVSSDRIRVSSAGEDSPVAPNTTAIGRQQNRRIIIKRDN